MLSLLHVCYYDKKSVTASGHVRSCASSSLDGGQPETLKSHYHGQSFHYENVSLLYQAKTQLMRNYIFLLSGECFAIGENQKSDLQQYSMQHWIGLSKKHFIWNNGPHSFNCFIYLWLISFPGLASQNTCLNGLSNKDSSRVFFSLLSLRSDRLF